MDKDIDKESFYERYIFYIWYCFGYIAYISKAFISGSINDSNIVEILSYAFVMAVPIAFVMYVVLIFTWLPVFVLFEGIREKDLTSVVFGIFLFIIFPVMMFLGWYLGAG